MISLSATFLVLIPKKEGAENLRGFCPGLKINLGKSTILPVGKVDNTESLALELGCNIGFFPTT